MKYIDADKLRAEIERLKRQAEGSKMEWVNEGYNQNAFAEDCRISSFDKSLSFLDTLEEPVSDCHDLEEEYQEFCKDYPFPWSSQYLNREYIDELCLSVARHFAEWQKAKMMEGAVEGTVIELGETYKDLSLSVNAKELNQVLQLLGVGDGNKVKIIIVKEEEKCL